MKNREKIVHSMLYHLKPEGVGTPAVEGLSSYLMRLASAHRLTTYDLVKYINSQLILNANKFSSNFFVEDAYSLNGMGKYAAFYSRSLQTLTLRNDLDLLCMLPWQASIDARGKGLIEKARRWCPICFNEQQAKGEIRYEHLIWSISIQHSCSLHKVPLQTACPYCHGKQPALSRRVPIGFCTRCGSDLSIIDKYNYQIDKRSHWSAWAESELALLISANSEAKGIATKDNFTQKLAILINSLTKGNSSKLSRACKFSPSTLAQWRRGKCLPRFDYLFFFCYCIGISPSNFLLGDITDANQKAKFPSIKLNTVTPSSGERKKYDHAEVESKLDQIISSGKILSYKKVAQQLGVGTSYLRYRFPDKVATITSRFKKHMLSITAKNLEIRNQKIEGAVYALHRQGVYPSHKKVFCDVIQPASYTTNSGAISVWRQAKKNLGYH